SHFQAAALDSAGLHSSADTPCRGERRAGLSQTGRSLSGRVLGLASCRRKRRTWRRHVPCRRGRGVSWALGWVAMAFTLYSLLQAALLCVNAIAVLHEERFLKNIGWGTDQGIGGFGEEPGIKSQLMNLIRSVRTVMRGKKQN
uniref:Immediate early response 3-interacting protein 1 n=1 Tax=Bos indicus x Bos taurus TaxID=30522 RepID=A0A4W2BTW7_BOBOX